jgi:hypothetical protein
MGVGAASLSSELLRGPILQGAVWPSAVVVLPPGVQFLLGVSQVQEPVLIEAFNPETPVEGLNQAIVSRILDPHGLPGRLKSSVTPFQ